MVDVMLIGPTSTAWEVIAEEVEVDLRRLGRPGVRLTYRTTGIGPASIRTSADAVAAAPHVVRTAQAAEKEGFAGVIVDCADDPGVAEASHRVAIPVIGAGSALAAATRYATEPICRLSGDNLRQLTIEGLVERISGAATVALDATGFSHLAEVLRNHAPHVLVLDPLPLALEVCLQQIDPSMDHQARPPAEMDAASRRERSR